MEENYLASFSNGTQHAQGGYAISEAIATMQCKRHGEIMVGYQPIHILQMCGPIGSLLNRSTCSHTTIFCFPPNYCGSMVLQSVSICKKGTIIVRWHYFSPGTSVVNWETKRIDLVIICSNKTVNFII